MNPVLGSFMNFVNIVFKILMLVLICSVCPSKGVDFGYDESHNCIAFVQSEQQSACHEIWELIRLTSIVAMNIRQRCSFWDCLHALEQTIELVLHPAS